MAAEYPKDFILYDVSHDQVYLTGSWCDWKPNAIKMTKIPNLYFIATVLLPYNTKVAYKYIVNDTWMTNPEEQSETDAAGNTNNVFTTPSEAEATAHAVPAAHQSSGLTAPLTGTSATSAPANSSNTAHSGAAEEIQEAKASGVNVGAAAAQSGIADAAAETAAAHGLGQSTAPTGAEEILEAKTSGVPVGAELAGAGIAAAAAGSAAAHGLGKSEAEGVTGVEKVAPNVTQATSTSSPSGVGSDKDLAKPDLGSSSTSTHSKAPLPASTADAPVAPGSATGEVEHKGLFSVIGGLAAGAAGAAVKAAYDLEHKIEEKLQGESHPTSSASSNVLGSTEGNKSVLPTANEKMITTAHAGTLSSGASSAISPSPSATTSHKENPAAALDPIATNAGVSKITKEFAAVDFDHTKQEVVHAVERLGEVIAGGLSGLGAAHEGRDLPVVSDFWAKKGSASVTSAFGKSIHENEPTTNGNTTTTGKNGVTPLGGLASFSSPAAAWPANNGAPSAGVTTGASTTSTSKDGNTASKATDGSSASAHTLPPVTGGPALYPTGTSAPKEIKIETPKTNTSDIQAESAKAGAHAPALNGNNTNVGSSTTGTTGTSGPAKASTASTATPSATAHTSVAAPTAATAAAASTAGSSHHHDKKQPSIVDDLKKGIKNDNHSATAAPIGTAPTGGMLGPAAVADHESHGLINNNKKDASTLGVASGTTAASSSAAAPPVTPKKTAAATPGATSSAATPATPKTEGYNTAPSTPSGTPDDRKRKSSIFRKIKSALSPSK